MTKRKFLSIKEAARLSGKSESTIKRFIKKTYNTGQLEKDQLINQRIKKTRAPKGFFWFIAKDFLEKSFSSAEPTELTENGTIKILYEQLQTKDKQIESLLARQHEHNVLMKGLQEKVLTLETGQQEQSISKAKVNQADKKQKKGFWRRVFS